MPLHPASMFTCWNQVSGNSPAGAVPPPPTSCLPTVALCGSYPLLVGTCIKLPPQEASLCLSSSRETPWPPHPYSAS